MSDFDEKQKNFDIKKLKGSQIEITAEISPEDFEKQHSRALKKLGESVSIDGFRKGHIPEAVLAQKIGDSALLQEMAELAIADFYLKFLEEEKVPAIGRPSIVITKIARKNPLNFKITTAVLPEITLPDYKIIAKNVNVQKRETPMVTDKEVGEIMAEIKKTQQSVDNPPRSDLDELSTDKIRESLQKEKELKEREKVRLKIIEEITKEIQAEIPDILIENEVEKMFAQFKENISRAGLTIKDYFAQIKKTEDYVKKERRNEAEKRVKIQFALSEIAKKENIVVSKDELDAEVARMLAYYKKADKGTVRAYIENLLTNERVFQFLEACGVDARNTT